MATLRVFNIGNDLALAHELEHPGQPYTLPRAVRQMEADLRDAPRLWMAPDDILLHQWRPGLDHVEAVEPWGWSVTLVRQLRRMGVAERLLPSDLWLERNLQLSHRRCAVELSVRLAKAGFPSPNAPVEAFSLDEFRGKRPVGAAVVKSPLSGSGRGVFPLGGRSEDEESRLVEGLIRHQGSVIVERMLAKERDFSALFRCDGSGEVRFRGMSLFRATADCTYLCNEVSPAATPRLAAPLVEALESALTEMGYGEGYRGWVGVDMLEGPEGLAPCIEINRRMTMGVVALLLTERSHEPGLLGLALDQGRWSLAVRRG